MALTLRTSQQDAATVIEATGDIDIRTAPALRDLLTDAAAGDGPGDGVPQRVVVDLAGTDFIDSSALGVLVGANRQLSQAGSRLLLVCAKPHLLKVFEITRLQDVIPIHATVADALA